MVPNRKSVACMLALIMLLLTIPAFASSETGTVDLQGSETTEQTEQTEQTAEEAGTEEVKEDDLQNEDAVEQPEQTEQTEDPGTGEHSDAQSTEAVEKEKQAKQAKVPALKAESGLPANNTKVSYTSAGSHPVKFTVKTGGHTFKGTCATLGVDNAKSGKATVKRISNDSKIAKLVYYYGYEKGWWRGTNATKKATKVLNFTDSNCTENAKQCIEALIQRDNMGWDSFWAARKVNGYRMYSTDSFMRAINNLYKNTDASKITIPDDVVFEMFHGTTSSSKVQDFYVWRYRKITTTTNGFVVVEKVSDDVSITD